MMNSLSISALRRLTNLVATGIFYSYSTTFAFAAPATGRVPEARHAFVTCVNTVFPKLAQIPDLKPVGVAYFVGLSCGEKREAYASSLSELNIPDSAKYIEKIDTIVVREVLRRLAALKRPDDGNLLKRQ